MIAQNMLPMEAAEVDRLLGVWLKNSSLADTNRLNAYVHVVDLRAVVHALVTAQWGYLSAITGIDRGVEAGIIEVLYHFCEGATVLTLRVEVPRDLAAVPSVCDMVPYASMFERELIEMFGVTVIDTPDPSHLFLPDDWPQGVHPLRKDSFTKEVTV
jgi:formate hydrogenlyase subunit 5